MQASTTIMTKSRAHLLALHCRFAAMQVLRLEESGESETLANVPTEERRQHVRYTSVYAVYVCLCCTDAQMKSSNNFLEQSIYTHLCSRTSGRVARNCSSEGKKHTQTDTDTMESRDIDK